jgi:hypothetical protein
MALTTLPCATALACSTKDALVGLFNFEGQQEFEEIEGSKSSEVLVFWQFLLNLILKNIQSLAKL